MPRSFSLTSDGINRDASLTIPSSRSTASRFSRLSVKLSSDCPAVIFRVLAIAVAIWSILAPIVGRTSEYFNNIVSNSLSEARRNGATHRGLRWQASRVLDDMLYTDEIKKREGCIGFDFDEHIDIAVRSIVAAYARAENSKLGHAFGPECLSAFSNSRDDFVASHGVVQVVIQSSLTATPPPRYAPAARSACGSALRRRRRSRCRAGRSPRRRPCTARRNPAAAPRRR